MTAPNVSISRDARVTALGVAGFALALAAGSHVAIPLPGTPVPFTLQPLVVVLAGLFLGPRAGAASMVLYVLAGIAGLPVFAPMGAPGIARLAGPTGGYIIAYPLAAWVAGMVARDGAAFGRRVLAAAAGIAVIHLGGLTQLSILTGSATSALALGFKPFIAFDAVKALIAGALSGTARAPRRNAGG